MKSRCTGAAALRVSLLLLSTCLMNAVSPSQAVSAEKKYSFAVVPQFEQRKLFAIWQPIVDELERRTGLSFGLVTTLTIEDFDREFERGEYDFSYVNPYLAARAAASHGYVPLAADANPLRGIVVVRKGSPVKDLSALRDKVVAFPAPNAIGATLLVLADLDQVFHARVKPLFVKTHSSVYLHVAKELVEAGGGVEKTLHEQPQEIRDALRVLYTTRAFPSHPVAAHPRVPKEDREKVRRALLAIAASPAGREMLLRIPIRQLGPAEPADYTKMLTWGLDKYILPGED